jgi:hypothetical protein
VVLPTWRCGSAFPLGGPRWILVVCTTSGWAEVQRMSHTMVDRKGVISFLVITFGITYAIEGMLILAGFRMTEIPPLYGQFIIAGVMWVPALATVLTIK